MSPGTLATILTTAPAVVQTVTRLIRTLRDDERPRGADAEIPATLAGLKTEVQHLSERLQRNSENDVQQLQLIEALARQNETLAAALARLSRRLALVAGVAAAA